MTRAVFLWGLLEDLTFRSVCECLQASGANVLFFNHAAIGRQRVKLEVGEGITYTLMSAGLTCRLDSVSAAYLRPYDVRFYEPEGSAVDADVHSQDPKLVQQLVNAWAEYSPARIIHRPSAEGSNHSKLYQALRIREAGFLTPTSLISNDREKIRAFLADHGRAIYKSMSSVRSIVRELEPQNLDGMDLGPVLFQELIVGRQYRIHVVADRYFAHAIDSREIDYRYADSRISDCDIPTSVAQRCVAMTQALGLTLGGIDLIQASSGDWYCLEVNSNPGFSYYDISGERKVARALAEELMSSSRMA